MSQDTPHIVGLGGSLGTPSTSLEALRVALDGAADAGATTELFALRDLDLPLFVPDTPAPESVERLCDAIERAHGMIWSAPLYHGSVSGSFKNAIDWLQVLSDRGVPYLLDKVVGLVATAGGVQTLNAINAMEFTVRALRGFTVPLVVPVARSGRAFDGDGRIVDDAAREQLRRLGAEVTRSARRLAVDGEPVLQRA